MLTCGIVYSCYGLLILALPVAWAQGDGCVSSSLADYSTRNPHCTVRSDCLGVDCSVPEAQGLTASLTVSNCEDPVRVHLSVVGAAAGICEKTFSVGGSGIYVENTTATVDGSQARFVSTYDRNTSHLYFHVAVNRADSSITYVPEAWFPLTPASCTCAELYNISNHFTFPSVTPSCATDDANTGSATPSALCGGFHCNITYAGSTVVSHSTVDPCMETLLIRVVDSSGQPVFDHVFNQSQSMPFALEPVNPTLYVLLTHYNYSMEVGVIMNIQLFTSSSNQTLVAPQRIILDRSSCSPLISFPAAPVPSGSSAKMCQNSSVTTATTQAPQRSIVAIAVAVPVTIVMVGIILTSIFLTVFLLYFRARKRREVEFRRVAFDEMEDED